VLKIEETIQLISRNPELFQESESAKLRRVVIFKFNTMYYRITNGDIEILTSSLKDKIHEIEKFG